MRTLLIFVLLASTASASDVEVRTRTAIAIAKARLAVAVIPPKKVAAKKSGEVSYFHAVKHGYAQPRNWDIEGNDSASKEETMQHLYSDHSMLLPKALDGRVLDLSILSYADLRAIHGMAHDGRQLGRWLPTVCPLDGGPCQMTWQWEIP